MRIAALYDIHGNLPALEAVADDIRRSDVGCVVVGGDVLPGPMPNETLDVLFDLGVSVQFIHGNGDLAVLEQIGASKDHRAVKYWGTTNGEPLPASAQAIVRWTADVLRPDHAERMSTWPRMLRLGIDGAGETVFCHGTPRSEVECFTRLTPEDRLLGVFGGLNAQLVVCGHTHMQFDRTIGGTRVVNAGSVGMPFQTPAGAYWLLVGPTPELRCTPYDFGLAAERVRATRYPQADDFAARSILNPPHESEMLEVFTSVSFR